MLTLAYGYEDKDRIFPMPEPHVSLPIRLFDEGYDVWIDGNRGGLYQRGHSDEDITQEKYWDWGMNQQGIEDQGAQIEYIIGATGQESLNYVGYSMGTMQLYYALGMAAEDEELAKTFNNIEKFISTTPCSWDSFAMRDDEAE